MNSPLLGLDIGLRRTGVSLSESGLLAQPLTTIEWQPPHATHLINEVIALIELHGIRTVVVGIPYDEEGADTGQALKTERLVEQLAASLGARLPEVRIERYNEFHSTQDARQIFPGSDKDSAAAAVILQDYIELNGASW